MCVKSYWYLLDTATVTTRGGVEFTEPMDYLYSLATSVLDGDAAAYKVIFTFELLSKCCASVIDVWESGTEKMIGFLEYTIPGIDVCDINKTTAALKFAMAALSVLDFSDTDGLAPGDKHLADNVEEWAITLLDRVLYFLQNLGSNEQSEEKRSNPRQGLGAWKTRCIEQKKVFQLYARVISLLMRRCSPEFFQKFILPKVLEFAFSVNVAPRQEEAYVLMRECGRAFPDIVIPPVLSHLKAEILGGPARKKRRMEDVAWGTRDADSERRSIFLDPGGMEKPFSASAKSAADLYCVASGAIRCAGDAVLGHVDAIVALINVGLAHEKPTVFVAAGSLLRSVLHCLSQVYERDVGVPRSAPLRAHLRVSTLPGEKSHPVAWHIPSSKDCKAVNDVIRSVFKGAMPLLQRSPTSLFLQLEENGELLAFLWALRTTFIGASPLLHAELLGSSDGDDVEQFSNNMSELSIGDVVMVEPQEDFVPFHDFLASVSEFATSRTSTAPKCTGRCPSRLLAKSVISDEKSLEPLTSFRKLVYAKLSGLLSPILQRKGDNVKTISVCIQLLESILRCCHGPNSQTMSKVSHWNKLFSESWDSVLPNRVRGILREGKRDSSFRSIRVERAFVKYYRRSKYWQRFLIRSEYERHVPLLHTLHLLSFHAYILIRWQAQKALAKAVPCRGKYREVLYASILAKMGEKSNEKEIIKGATHLLQLPAVVGRLCSDGRYFPKLLEVICKSDIQENEKAQFGILSVFLLASINYCPDSKSSAERDWLPVLESLLSNLEKQKVESMHYKFVLFYSVSLFLLGNGAVAASSPEKMLQLAPAFSNISQRMLPIFQEIMVCESSMRPMGIIFMTFAMHISSKVLSDLPVLGSLAGIKHGQILRDEKTIVKWMKYLASDHNIHESKSEVPSPAVPRGGKTAIQVLSLSNGFPFKKAASLVHFPLGDHFNLNNVQFFKEAAKLQGDAFWLDPVSKEPNTLLGEILKFSLSDDVEQQTVAAEATAGILVGAGGLGGMEEGGLCATIRQCMLDAMQSAMAESMSNWGAALFCIAIEGDADFVLTLTEDLLSGLSLSLDVGVQSFISQTRGLLYLSCCFVGLAGNPSFLSSQGVRGDDVFLRFDLLRGAAMERLLPYCAHPNLNVRTEIGRLLARLVLYPTPISPVSHPVLHRKLGVLLGALTPAASPREVMDDCEDKVKEISNTYGTFLAFLGHLWKLAPAPVVRSLDAIPDRALQPLPTLSSVVEFGFCSQPFPAPPAGGVDKWAATPGPCNCVDRGHRTCLPGHFLEILLRSQADADLEVLKEGKKMAALASQFPFARSALPCIVRAVQRLSACDEWRIRVILPPFLQLFGFMQSPYLDALLLETMCKCILNLLCDPQPDVRLAALECLKSFLMSNGSYLREFLSANLNKLMLVFLKKQSRKQDKGKAEVDREENASLKLIGAASALSAIVAASPYDLPSYVPSTLAVLARVKRATRSSAVSEIIRRTFVEFWRTHGEEWSTKWKFEFSEDELDDVRDMLLSPNYYA